MTAAVIVTHIRSKTKGVCLLVTHSFIAAMNIIKYLMTTVRFKPKNENAYTLIAFQNASLCISFDYWINHPLAAKDAFQEAHY